MSESQRPTAFGKYQVVQVLGVGAFGVVYRCHDPALDRTVAVKVLAAGGHATPNNAARFLREARAAARLAHPHIVSVFDVGEEAGQPYLVMEFVDGQTLERLIGSPRLTVEATLRVVFHLAQALQAAHDQGVVHRDVKPANVLIDPAGRPKLADFGLAVLTADARLSLSGEIVGTPRYMSPEQALLPPDEIDHRTDVYSLGAVMYEMLTGRPAADGANAIAVLRRVTDEEPAAVRDVNPGVPPEVAAVCARMMAKDRSSRYQSAAEVAHDIQAYFLGKMFGTPEVEVLAGLLPAPAPVARPRRRRAILAAATLTLTLAGAVAARLASPPAPSGAVVAPTPAHAPEVPPAIDAAEVVARATAQLAILHLVADDGTYRDRAAESLADLGAVLKQNRDDLGARAARGRLLRRAGEYAAAIADLDRVAAGDPLSATERPLARYHFEVLYLGSCAEPALRPVPSADLRADFARLADGPEPRRTLGRLGAALTDPDPDALRKAAGEQVVAPTDLWRGDVLMLEADVLGRCAQAAQDEVAGAPDDEKPAARKRRDDLGGRAAQAVRRGLEADPHHLGLLFLKANAWSRRVEWEGSDGEDRVQAVRRLRSGFDAAYQRFRSAAPRFGVEAAVGRAVLLSNFGQNDFALDQLAEAAGRGPVPPSVIALRAWFELYNPPDGELTPAYAGQVLQRLGTAFESPPDQFTAYLTRALAHAAAGQWDDARRDLLDGRRAYRGPVWPPPGEHEAWCQAAPGPVVKFLDATAVTLWSLPTPGDLRFRLQDEVLKRLTGPDAAQRAGATDEEVRGMAARGHYRLARFWADKDDRANVLKHARLALEFRNPDLTPQTFRDDPVFKAWSNEGEFTKLYAEFERKGHPDGTH